MIFSKEPRETMFGQDNLGPFAPHGTMFPQELESLCPRQPCFPRELGPICLGQSCVPWGPLHGELFCNGPKMRINCHPLYLGNKWENHYFFGKILGPFALDNHVSPGPLHIELNCNGPKLPQANVFL